MTKQAHVMTLTGEGELPPLLERHADFTVWMLNKVRKFPKDLRFSLGAHITDTCLAVMDFLTESLFTKDKGRRMDKLERISLLLEQLRLQLRLAWQLRIINARALHYATGCLQDQGRMLGGWIRTTESRRDKKRMDENTRHDRT